MNRYFSKLMNQFIRKYDLKKILIAISGGQDSICLMKLIDNFTQNHNYIEVEYIYIDHQWKIDSKMQIEHLINYCKNFKKKLTIYQIKKISLSEDISRKYRYHIIIRHATYYKYKIIFTAHTKTDKLETFFYNLMRGTGIEGVTSLNLHRKYNSTLNIFRPLIKQNRININFFCRRWLLPIWSDTTNYNYSTSRNRIRNEIFPYLKKYFNINIEKNWLIFLHNCYYDNEYIKQKVIRLYLKNKHNTYIALKKSSIRKEHFTIQIKVLRLLIYHNFKIETSGNLLIKIINQINNKQSNYNVQIIYKFIKFNINQNWIYII
uniref:tRNA(Ile)-lysidine synthase, chloroplastic n=1 Tax=Thuretia quercifolia TaxID=189650 RepID=A0A1Z1MKU3_9FLOR|nr:tRNA Ile-lysidine synthetase [Thuretia quercifolia]ARW66361.1 tRNA Ile-lysidine synthetase [Thuretia quercifolia]